jgi:hypothetical protein
MLLLNLCRGSCTQPSDRGGVAAGKGTLLGSGATTNRQRHAADFSLKGAKQGDSRQGESAREKEKARRPGSPGWQAGGGHHPSPYVLYSQQPVGGSRQLEQEAGAAMKVWAPLSRLAVAIVGTEGTRLILTFALVGGPERLPHSLVNPTARPATPAPPRRPTAPRPPACQAARRTRRSTCRHTEDGDRMGWKLAATAKGHRCSVSPSASKVLTGTARWTSSPHIH